MYVLQSTLLNYFRDCPRNLGFVGGSAGPFFELFNSFTCQVSNFPKYLFSMNVLDSFRIRPNNMADPQSRIMCLGGRWRSNFNPPVFEMTSAIWRRVVPFWDTLCLMWSVKIKCQMGSNRAKQFKRFLFCFWDFEVFYCVRFGARGAHNCEKALLFLVFFVALALAGCLQSAFYDDADAGGG